MNPTPITRSTLRAASVRSALSRSAPSLGSMYSTCTPSSASARSSPRHAAVLNDSSFLPPMSNTSPMRTRLPPAAAPADTNTAPAATSTTFSATRIPISRGAVTGRSVLRDLLDHRPRAVLHDHRIERDRPAVELAGVDRPQVGDVDLPVAVERRADQVAPRIRRLI